MIWTLASAIGPPCWSRTNPAILPRVVSSCAHICFAGPSRNSKATTLSAANPWVRLNWRAKGIGTDNEAAVAWTCGDCAEPTPPDFLDSCKGKKNDWCFKDSQARNMTKRVSPSHSGLEATPNGLPTRQNG